MYASLRDESSWADMRIEYTPPSDAVTTDFLIVNNNYSTRIAPWAISPSLVPNWALKQSWSQVWSEQGALATTKFTYNNKDFYISTGVAYLKQYFTSQSIVDIVNFNFAPDEFTSSGGQVPNELLEYAYNFYYVSPPSHNFYPKLYCDGNKYPNIKLTWRTTDDDYNNYLVNIGVKASDQLGAFTQVALVPFEQFVYENNWKTLADLCGFDWFDKIFGKLNPLDYSIDLLWEVYEGSMDGELIGQIVYTIPWNTNNAQDVTISHQLNIGETGESTPEETTEDGNGYDDDHYIDNHGTIEEQTAPQPLSIDGLFSTTYKMTSARLRQLSSVLWSQGFLDNFALLTNDPIEALVSCKLTPFNIGSGTDESIKMGNVDTGVNGERVDNISHVFTIGSLSIPTQYNNFLDRSPYTKVTIFLPFIGFRELPVDLVMGKTITVKYLVDMLTGGCIAEIYTSNTLLQTYNGSCSIDIPLTAQNRAQIESAYIGGIVGGVGSLAVGNVAGAVASLVEGATAKHTIETSGAPSSACAGQQTRTCYVIIDRPQVTIPTTFAHDYGRLCMLTRTISNCRGFVKVAPSVDLSGIPCSNEEREQIRDAITNGIFV